MVLLYLAWKNLTSRKSAAAAMIAAVAFGLAFQWPNTANLSGYSQEFFNKFIHRGTGHFRVFHESEKFFDPVGPLAELNDRAGNRFTFKRPRLRLFGVVSEAGRRENHLGAEFLGVGPEEFRAMGGEAPGGDAPVALVGAVVLNKLRLSKGQPLEVILAVGARPRVLIIRSYRKANYGVRVRSQIVFNLAKLQNYSGIHGKVSEIVLVSRLREMPGLPRFRFKAKGFYLEPWWRSLRFIYAAVRGNEVIRLISSAMTLFGILIPILALMYVTVLRDREQIAILSACGFRRIHIFLIYAFYGCFVAICGIVPGTLLGYGLLKYFEYRPIFQTAYFAIRPSWEVADFAFSLGLVFLTTLFGAIYPALRAARQEAARTFRGND